MTRALRLVLCVLAALLSAPALARRSFLPSPLQLHRVPTHLAAVGPSAAVMSSRQLPVFFFHGVTATESSAFHYAQNLTGEGRVVVALNFCPGRCSVEGLQDQVQLAIPMIRGVINANAELFQHGYIFIGHSQGGALARAVLEHWDEHNVKFFISLAGAQNGIFFGPQPEDQVALQVFMHSLGPQMIPRSLLDFSAYSPGDLRGKFQFDMSETMLAHPEGQAKYSGFNLARSPDHARWAAANPFLPVINNVNPCGPADADCLAAKRRRRDNFLRLEAAHFFASPEDQVISPWQSSVLAQYSDVANGSDIETAFEALRIVDMQHTPEYLDDSYGLRSLDARGGLHLHVVPDVRHSCWVADTPSVVDPKQVCRFAPVYEQHIYPLLQTMVVKQ
ncbi:hypothetical protein P43SY_003575 [Pythium insidiosum]|uniref:Lysosomal thioesterase PPT2 n=1 Tax=Pythium insidiosum TaxID=114742 RepID=A0AAD5Q7A8_PYTIN|nr:hypothetical protein P43SY_003575 [Pythium insidiosum]